MVEVQVETTSGPIRGSAAHGVRAFKGVPYAAPPTGPRRFRPPAPPAPWREVRDATALGPSCPQPVERPEGWPPEHAESEDCLYLNVWAPEEAAGPLPVLVFLHGGGFTVGSGSWPLYDGAALARRGAVVVTVNHRLGILGYLHLGELVDGEDDRRAAGNAGMLDLVAALGWVRDNVAALGGDPGNVTIFGESGGGAKVCLLLAMPAARGLFHKAVVQSGPALRVRSARRAALEAQAVLDDLGLEPSRLDELHDVPVERLLAAQRRVGGGALALRDFSPVLDGHHIPDHPGDVLAAGGAADIPMIVGTTRDEATLFLAGDPALADPSSLDDDGVRRRLAHLGDSAADVVAAYRAARPDATPLDLLIAVQSDLFMRIPTIRLAERKLAGGGAPVYAFLFCWAAGPMRAGHGFELPFVFDNARPPVMEPSPSRAELAARMSEAWVRFARSGDPGHDGLPPWPPYDTERRATMRFDRGPCEVVDDPYPQERRAWEVPGLPALGF